MNAVRRRVVVLPAVVAVAVAGCRAPGEPPSHPASGEYRDVIRRELDAAGTALATATLTLRYVREGKVPETYADVVVRQAANDLRKVAQDLQEITPPADAARAQAALLAIAQRDDARLEAVRSHLHDAVYRERIRTAVSDDSDALDFTLTPELDP